MNFIGQNIRHLRLINGLSQTKMGSILKCTRDNIASYESGTQPKTDLLLRIVDNFHISVDDLINTDLSLKNNESLDGIYKDTISTIKPESKDYKKTIPLIPVEAVAGIGVQNDYSINLDQIEERYEVPLFKNKGVDFLTYIRGNSMYPKYNAGDVVACSFLRERLYIQWGRVYVLDTKSQGPLIKRLIKGGTDDYLVCRSENEKYGDFNVPFSDIRSLSLVVGVIRLE